MANTKILYLEANKRNVIDPFLRHNPGHWLRGEDGKIDHHRRMHPHPPWIYTKGRENQNCHFWHKILFNVLYQQNKIPSPCLGCWKVVFMPRNFEELLAAYIMQKTLNIPGKSGTEGARDNTDRLYGSYYYNPTQEKGMECFNLIKKTMEQREWKYSFFGVPVTAKFYDKGDVMHWFQGDIIVDGPPKVILKRGCTEFEQNVGRSDKWDESVNDDQMEQEYLWKDAFVLDHPNMQQSDHQLAQVIQKWIHNAYQWGDQSYLKYTNNNRLYNPPITYHDKQEETEDGKECT